MSDNYNNETNVNSCDILTGEVEQHELPLLTTEDLQRLIEQEYWYLPHAICYAMGWNVEGISRSITRGTLSDSSNLKIKKQAVDNFDRLFQIANSDIEDTINKKFYDDEHNLKSKLPIYNEEEEDILLDSEILSYFNREVCPKEFLLWLQGRVPGYHNCKEIKLPIFLFVQCDEFMGKVLFISNDDDSPKHLASDKEICSLLKDIEILYPLLTKEKLEIYRKEESWDIRYAILYACGFDAKEMKELAKYPTFTAYAADGSEVKRYDDLYRLINSNKGQLQIRGNNIESKTFIEWTYTLGRSFPIHCLLPKRDHPMLKDDIEVGYASNGYTTKLIQLLFSAIDEFDINSDNQPKAGDLIKEKTDDGGLQWWFYNKLRKELNIESKKLATCMSQIVRLEGKRSGGNKKRR